MQKRFRRWIAVLAALLMICGAAALTEGGGRARADGTLPSLQLQVTDSTVRRGEFLEIQVLNHSEYAPFAYMGGEYRISAVVSSTWFGDSNAYGCNRWGFIRIPTQNLNPETYLTEEDQGQFTVTVEAFDGSGNSVSGEVRFTVTEPEAGELYFRVSTEEAVTGETYILTAYAPGAYRIEVYDTFDDVKFENWGEELYAPDGYNFRDMFSYWAKAYFQDDQGEEFFRVSDTLTVNVTADNDVPAIDVGFDPVLAAGDDLVFQVPAAVGYSSWNLRVLRDRDGWAIPSMHHYRSEYEENYGQTPPGQAYEIRIPTAWTATDYDEEGNPSGQHSEYILEPGEAYTVELGFFQYNSHGFSFSAPLLVAGENTVSDRAEMTVNGQTGTFHAKAHQDMSFHARGPAEATGLLVYEGHGWQFYEGNEVYSDWGWWTMSHIPEYLFYAKYTTDPIPDTEYDWRSLTFSNTVSNVVHVINDTQGYLPVPAFTLNTDGNGEIVRGQWLEAAVSNLSEYSGYENIRFFATVYDSVTGEGFGRRIYGDGTESLRIPTAGIDPSGRTEPLTVDVTATTDAGWYQRTGYGEFTVTEPASQTPVFSVSPETVQTGDEYTVSLYAPGAAAYRIIDKENNDWIWSSGEGGARTETGSDDRSGHKTYEAQVRYENSEEWISAGTAEVAVTAPKGALPALTLDAPMFLDEGEDWCLAWDGLDSMDGVSLSLEVWRESDGERVWHSWDPQKRLTVSSVQPEQSYRMEPLLAPGAAVLEAGETYRARLVIGKRGYEGTELQSFVYILSDDEEQVQGTLKLKLNGSSAFIQEIPVQSQVIVTVEAPGATGIRVLDPNRLGSRTEPEEDDWEYYDQNQVNDYLELTWRFDLQARRIQAQARYDDYEDIRDQSGAETPWTAVSNDILLGITGGNTRFPDPQVTASAASVARGAWITFTAAPKGLGEWTWAEIGRVDGDDIDWLDHVDFSDAGVLCLNTMAYEVGSYCAQIFQTAPGYAISGETMVFFDITGSGTAAGGLAVSTGTADPNESFFLCAWAPEADRMRLEITREGQPDWYNSREWNGTPAVYEVWRFGEPGTYHFELKDKATGNRIGNVQTVTVGMGAGALARPDLSALPGMIGSGDAYSGSFSVDSRTEWVDVDVNYIPDDGPWQSIYQSSRTAGDADWTALSLPASVLSRAGIYRINVYTHAAGYGSIWNSKTFAVRPAGGADITLTVNGGSSDIADWPSSVNLTVLAQAEGATAFRLLRGESWDYREARNGRAEWDVSFSDGDYTLVAQMTTDAPVWEEENFDWSRFNWNDLNWTGMSNAVRVRVTSTGSLTAPEVTLTPAGGTVVCGEILTVEAAPQEHAQWMSAELAVLRTDENGGRWFENVPDSYFGSGDGVWSVRIPTGWFEPGEYWLRVGVDAEGWEGQETVLPLTIQESAEPQDVSLFLDRETMRSGEGLTIYARAPGAERLELEITWDRDAGWRDGRWSGGEQGRWDWGCGCGGVYTFTLMAWMPGEDAPRTAEQTLTVISEGQLAAPAVTGVPGILEWGSGISGSFEAVEGAESYNVGIRYAEHGWDWEDLLNEDRQAEAPGATALVFGAEEFDRCGSYQLWVSANAIGMDNGYTEVRIEVIDPQTVDGRLTLKVNGQTDGSQAGEIFLHQNMPVTLEAPERVTAVRVKSSTRNEWEPRAVMSEEDLTWDWGFHEGGADTLIAQAAADPAVSAWCDAHDGMQDFDWSQVEWTMTSNAVTVQVIKYGDLEAPRIDFVNGTTLERGAWLTFDLHPVEHAWSYGVQVLRADDEEWDLIIDMDFSLTETTRISVPTDGLAPGEYRLHIDPRCYGWHGDSVGYPFTVTESAAPSEEPRFQISTHEMLTREELVYSIWAPGAEEILLCQERLTDENTWRQERGEILADHVILNWAKTYHLLAFARYPGEEKWVQIGQTQDVQVTAPNGALGLTIEAPETVRPDEELTVSLLCDYRGTDGAAECWAYDYGTDRDSEMELVSEGAEGDLYRMTFRLPADILTTGSCLVYAYAFPGSPGYELAYEESLVAVNGAQELGTLTVSKNPIEIFEDLTITVHADGATAVALWTSFDSGWYYEKGNTLTEVLTMWEDGVFSMYGLYTTEPVNPEEPGFDWAAVNWTGATNSLILTVNPPSAELEPLHYELSGTSVHRGEEIVITLLNRNEGVENVSYGAHLTLMEGEDPGYAWFGPDEDNIIRVNTAEAAPGTYDLLITANAVGCRGLMERVRVTVTAPAPMAVGTVLTLPAGLKVIEEEAFTGTAAEKIVVPAGTEEIGSRAFADCPNLVTLDLPQGLRIAPDALEGCAHPVMVYGPAGSWLEDYAQTVDNLWFVPVD